jgi:predicted dehydrogenase
MHIGLVVVGNITGTHANAACAIPSVQIAVIYGTNAEKVLALCRRHGGRLAPSHWDSWETAIDLSMVVVVEKLGISSATVCRRARRLAT